MTEQSRIAVVCGNGLQRPPCRRCKNSTGDEPVVIARSQGVDIITGFGLDAALQGVDAVIDVSKVTTLRRRTSVEFLAAASKNLLASGRRADVRHHVAL